MSLISIARRDDHSRKPPMSLPSMIAKGPQSVEHSGALHAITALGAAWFLWAAGSPSAAKGPR